MRARLREAVIGLALLSVAVIVSGVFAEVAVRLVAPQQLVLVRPDVWMPVDTLGWMKRPNLATEINTGEKTTSVFTDSLGLRVGAGGPTQSAKRVLLLGDSFMEALALEYEESLAGQLESALPAIVGEAVRVHNTGVGGWEPSQYLLQASRSLARERYELVLVSVYVGNDAVSARVENFAPRPLIGDNSFRLPQRATWSEFVEAIAYPLNQYLEERSHLFVFLKTKASTLRMRLGLSRLYFPTEHLRSERTSVRWDTTSAILADIAALAATKGIPTAFVLIPSNFQVHREILDSYVTGFKLDTTLIDLKQPNELLTDRMRARGLLVLDPLSHLQALSQERGRLFGAVDTHMNSAGSRALAEWLAPIVAEQMSSAPKN